MLNSHFKVQSLRFSIIIPSSLIQTKIIEQEWNIFPINTCPMWTGSSSCLQKAEAEDSGSSPTDKVFKVFLFASLCSINNVLPAES